MICKSSAFKVFRILGGPATVTVIAGPSIREPSPLYIPTFENVLSTGRSPISISTLTIGSSRSTFESGTSIAKFDAVKLSVRPESEIVSVITFGNAFTRLSGPRSNTDPLLGRTA
jgi:hypothetical protein